MLAARAFEILRNEGLGGLSRRVMRRLFPGAEQTHAADAVTHAQAMDWFRRKEGEYDELINAVRPYFKCDGVVFDIGANIGFFSFLMAKRLGFTGSIYLFEPVPHLAELCRETFRGAPCRAEVFAFGLSDKDSEADIHIAGNGNIGWNTLVSEMATPDMRKVRVRIRKFDSCGIDATPTLVKVDVEGSEYLVLRGLLDAMRRWNPLPVVLCEVGWGREHPAWAEEMAVFNEMKSIGYDICGLDGKPLDETKIQDTVDVLFLPRV